MEINKLSKIIIMLMMILLINNVTAVNAQEYKRYCNPRFGFCVSYPSYFNISPESKNKNGRHFYDYNGFVMITYARNNTLDETLQTEMQFESKDFDRITYRRKRKTWYVLSGYKGSNILYIKTYVGKKSSNYLHIEYPIDKKTEYDKIVTKISRSFKRGDINSRKY
jgi:hypothetical protein